MLAAPLTKLRKLKTLLEDLFVLMALVPDVFTLGALELDEVILRHIWQSISAEVYKNLCFLSIIRISPFFPQESVDLNGHISYTSHAFRRFQ